MALVLGALSSEEGRSAAYGHSVTLVAQPPADPVVAVGGARFGNTLPFALIAGGLWALSARDRLHQLSSTHRVMLAIGHPLQTMMPGRPGTPKMGAPGIPGTPPRA